MVAQASPASRGLVVGAVASGVATALLPPARIPTPVRRSLHAGLGLATGAATAWALGRPGSTGSEEPQEVLPLGARVALGTGFGSLVALASAAGTGVDTAAERALVRRGVRRPCLWIGLAAAGLTAVTSWAESWIDEEPNP